jgi:xylan 1,4-beta-xylosidase
LASNGIDKPVLNVFRMFGKMSGRRLAVESDRAVPLEVILRRGVRAEPDVSALASLDRNKLCVLVWHYHDDDVPGPAAEVELALTGLPLESGEASLEHFRIDQEHSNAFTAWQRMGSPQRPTPGQYAQLENAGQLAQMAGPQTVRVDQGHATVRLNLPRQAVSLLVLQWR